LLASRSAGVSSADDAGEVVTVRSVFEVAFVSATDTLTGCSTMPSLAISAAADSANSCRAMAGASSAAPNSAIRRGSGSWSGSPVDWNRSTAAQPPDPLVGEVGDERAIFAVADGGDVREAALDGCEDAREVRLPATGKPAQNPNLGGVQGGHRALVGFTERDGLGSGARR